MLNFVICDDNKSFLNRLEHILEKIFIDNNFNARVSFKSDNANDILNYVKTINLLEMDYVLLFVRLLFPSYYFDMYDKIINGELEEEKITQVTNYASEYEELLYNIYLVIKKHVNLIEINWLRKNNIVET